ncbi:MAG TPA: response regulator [bacterium]|nr:response regulator [bacterium]
MAKVLIVDDDPDIVKLYTTRLSQEGFSVVSVTDAYQGVKCARSEKPDLIVLDLMLPAGGAVFRL